MSIKNLKSIAETHCHTVASSHAYSTILENACYASKAGMYALAITEHGPTMPDAPYFWYFDNLKVVDRVLNGVIILRGAEANIIDFDGNIDLNKKSLGVLDWVIASFHNPVCAPSTIEDHTKAYVNIAKNPDVTVIGHCGHPSYVFDYEKGVKAFKEYDKIVEINAASFVVREGSKKNCAEIAKLCKKYRVPVVVSADAHFATRIGKVQPALDCLDEIDFPEELILNTDKDRFKEAIKKYCGLTDEELTIESENRQNEI